MVFFDSGSTTQHEKSRGKIDDILAQYKQDSRECGQPLRVTVTGYADAVGSQTANQALSLRRAEAVADLLEEGGVPRDRMVVIGKGDSRPLVVLSPQATAQERATALAMDRRVEVKTSLNW